jgi:hypothetical protein
MKLLINNYTFNPSLKTIAFTDYSQITLNGVLLVVNATASNKILYNFVDSTTNATASGNTLTLNASLSTSGMASTDKLIIFYEDVAANAYDNALYDIAQQLTILTNLRETNAALRVNSAGGSITTLTTLSNQGALGGYTASNLVPAQTNQAAIQSNINNVVIT